MVDKEVLAERISELFKFISSENLLQEDDEKKRKKILAYTLEKLVQNAFDYFILDD